MKFQSPYGQIEKFNNHPILEKEELITQALQDNQNWYRIVGENNLSKLSFLFPQGLIMAPMDIEKGFDPHAGWQR